jgi:phosphoglycolate phosphatase-like HAD superfamily hydrolase
MKTYGHVLFDFDGVLCDSASAAMEEYAGIRAKHFSCLPPVRNLDELGNVYSGSLRTCLHRWLTPTETKVFFDLHSAAMAQRIGSLALFEGARQALSLCGPRGASIVTSAYTDVVWALLRRDSEFDDTCVLTVAGRELHQTKTAKISAITSSIGIRCDDAVYVGDLESDILYCRDVPIDIIAVSYGYQPRHYLEGKGATYLLDSVDDLCTLIERCGPTGELYRS